MKPAVRPIFLAAVAAMLIAAGIDAIPEKAASARPAAARKPSYQEVRRGLFALSKIQTASIVMLGDSLTEGAPWRDLTGCLDVANRGIGGDTTQRVLDRLDEVLKLRPRAVFVMIGVNDISLHVPKEVTAANMRAILDRLNAADTHAFVSYVLPVAAAYARRGMNGEISDLNSSIAGLLAGRRDTTAIDLRPLVRGADGTLRDEFSYDGLHLSAKGYEVWRDAIAPHIGKYCAR